MKAKYLNTVKNLLRQTQPSLENEYKLTFKTCFGAVAAYVDDQIFATCGQFGVALKLPHSTVEHLLDKRGAELLRYSAKGRIKKNYVVIPRQLLADRKHLGELVAESVRFVTG